LTFSTYLYERKTTAQFCSVSVTTQSDAIHPCKKLQNVRTRNLEYSVVAQIILMCAIRKDFPIFASESGGQTVISRRSPEIRGGNFFFVSKRLSSVTRADRVQACASNRRVYTVSIGKKTYIIS